MRIDADPVPARPRRLLARAAALAALAALAASGVALARPEGAPVPVPGVAAAMFTKGPYLQALGPTGVTVKVELALPEAATVEVFPAGDLGDAGAPVASRVSDARPFHAVRIDGLAPATSYAYRVVAHGLASDAGRFTTAPADARPFRFLAYGDSRTDAAAHAAVVRAMEATPSDLLVNTGDMVAMGNEPRDWRELFAIEGRLLRDRCLFAAVGNHELARGDRAGEVAFLRYFTATNDGAPADRLYSTFRWSNTRFFVLNAMDTWTGDERAWLRSELDSALVEPGVAHRIALMHWGPFSSGPHGGNPALATGEVTAMMRDRRVDLVLAGHDHAYERGAGGGLKYVITGGTGAPLYTRKTHAPETRIYESAHHFVEVAVDGDRVALVARRASGGVIESCGYVADGPWDCDLVPPAAPSAAAHGGAEPTTSALPPRSRACACALPGVGDADAPGLVAVALGVLASRRRRRSPGNTSSTA